MRYALLGTILLITATAGFSQDRPSLTWEGEVTGTAVLMIHGERVDVDGRNSSSVARTSFRFNEPLPESNTRIDVENRLGGAQVRVVQQPRRNNDFTALVEIQARRSGWQRVSLDFYWDERGAVSRERGWGRERDRARGRERDRGYETRSRTNDRSGSAGSGSARWSGEVDNEVFVLMRGRQFFSTAVRGRSVNGQQIDVSSPLPRRPVMVQLQDAQGRGQVEIAEQPDQANNYTAKVRIVDPEAGAGAYSFALTWDESGDGYNSGASNPSYGSSSGGILSPGGGVDGNNSDYNRGASGLRWTGRVDGRVRVSFHDNQASVQRLSGQAVYDERVSFGAPVPRRSLDVDVRKLSGRGDVQVVQRPGPNNNYTLTVEIDDRDAGADMYDLEVQWR